VKIVGERTTAFSTGRTVGGIEFDTSDVETNTNVLGVTFSAEIVNLPVTLVEQ
jgi:hypothetical protein